MNTTSTALPTGTWVLDPTATSVAVTVKKLKLITVTGNLTVSSGSVLISDGEVAGVDVVADATSYNSSNAKRDEHVASPDFLDSATHPTITFSASARTDTNVTGTVTIKGRTTPVTFDVSAVKIDGGTATFTATAAVDRSRLGVDKLPGLIVSKDLDIVVAATAIRQS